MIYGIKIILSSVVKKIQNIMPELHLERMPIQCYTWHQHLGVY